VGPVGLGLRLSEQPRISEEEESLGRLVIWRVAPADFVIWSGSPGNRECGARFRLIRDRSAKFAISRGDSGAFGDCSDNLTLWRV
jgi:hypothetical protein